MTLCEALQAAQNRGTVDSAIPARVKLSVGWYNQLPSGLLHLNIVPRQRLKLLAQQVRGLPEWNNAAMLRPELPDYPS